MKFFTKPLSGIIILILLVGPPIESKESIDKKIWKEALKIHHQAIVIDTHCDTPMVMIDRGLDIGKRSAKSKVDLIRMKEGGVDASFFAIFVSNRMDNKHPARRALEMIDEIYNQVECYSQLARIAVSPQDIRDIHDSGKRAILIGMENGGPIEGSLRFLRNFYRLGFRYVTLTHGDNNDICDSSTAEKPRWNGLSEFGGKVVKEMNRLGMIIDVSHISDKAFWDVLEISRAPV
ncbi:MAG: membrane dipeptidase, partial [Methanomassiliicoccales archaeon]